MSMPGDDTSDEGIVASLPHWPVLLAGLFGVILIDAVLCLHCIGLDDGIICVAAAIDLTWLGRRRGYSCARVLITWRLTYYCRDRDVDLAVIPASLSCYSQWLT